MFFGMKKRQAGTVRFSDVDSLLIESDGVQFALFPNSRVIKYRNVISPGDARMRFPDGYFDKKRAVISGDDLKRIAGVFERMFGTRTPENELLPLPDGAVRQAYMQINLKGNRTAYYSNTHSADGFSVEREELAAEFTQLVQMLKTYCASAQRFPAGASGGMHQVGFAETACSREDEDTMQFCKACGRSFKMTLRYCPYCGTQSSLYRGEHTKQKVSFFDRVQPAPGDIALASHSVQGTAGGELIHIGMNCFYHQLDQTVYMENWGPGGPEVEKYRIPDQVPKTREAILRYLTEGKKVFIPR